MGKKLLLVSFDAVGSDELTILRELPNFKRIFANGSIFPNLKTVFISNNSQIIRVRILFGHRSGNQNQSTPFHFGLICRSPEVNMVPTKL